MPPPGPEPSRTSITVAASRGRTGSLVILVLLRGRWPNGTPREGGARPPGWAGPGLPRTVVSTSRPRPSGLARPRRRDHGKEAAHHDDHPHLYLAVQRRGVAPRVWSASSSAGGDGRTVPRGRGAPGPRGGPYPAFPGRGSRRRGPARALWRGRDVETTGKGQPTSTIISTSTGTSSGRAATPTALRACTPASPNTSPISSLAPLITCGWPENDGSLATNPTSLTTRRTADSSPTSALTAAIPFSAQIRASSAARSGVTSAPTLPVPAGAPSTSGTWPET